MAKEKSITFNFIMNGILTASSILFPLITFPYVSRVLGPEGTGAVSFATSIITYFSMFAQLGVPTYGVRACAVVKDNREELSRTVQEILIINLITCAISYAAFGLALAFVPRFRTEKTLFLVMGAMILFNTIGVEWLYKGLEQYGYITVRSLIFKVIALASMFLLVREESDYIIYGGITIVASTGSNLMNFLNLHKYVTLRPVGRYNLRRHLKAISIFFAMSVATTIYTHMDSAMLGFFRGNAENGYYDAAVKVKNVLVSFVASLGTVLLPRVSSYLRQDRKDEFYRLTRKALNFVLLLALPLCVYFTIYAKEAITLLSGPAYAAAVVPMQIIMCTVLFIGLTNIMGIQMLVPLGQERFVLYSEIAGAVVNVIVNAALIPSMGAAGAAIGTVLAELVVLVVQIVALGQTVLPMLRSLPYWKAVLAVLLGAAASSWVSFMAWGSFLTLAVSAVLFFGVYALALLLLKEPLIRECMEKGLHILQRKRESV